MIKRLLLLLLLYHTHSFATTYKISCNANFNPEDLNVQMIMKNLQYHPNQADLDFCFKIASETYYDRSYPYYSPRPRINMGYGRYNRHHGYYGAAFDPFYNDINVQRTVYKLSLIIKNQEGHIIWEDQSENSTSKISIDKVRNLLDHIPFNILYDKKSRMNQQTLPSSSLQNSEKKRLSPEEFEAIRLR